MLGTILRVQTMGHLHVPSSEGLRCNTNILIYRASPRNTSRSQIVPSARIEPGSFAIRHHTSLFYFQRFSYGDSPDGGTGKDAVFALGTYFPSEHL